jgi:adenosylmethionine-8-amino-7-oxononanoate aminotransferase
VAENRLDGRLRYDARVAPIRAQEPSMVTVTPIEELSRQDREHLIHPLYHPDDHAQPIIFVSGQGAVLKDIDGNEYIDGLACLWNVNVGHGRGELADVAAAQMRQLAYASAYTGSTNIPAIRLAEKLAELAYPNLNAVYFTSTGAESNESAFKTARFYWKAKGKPDKTKVVARFNSYHGVTLAAMSATGQPAYWKMFEPRVPGFVHIPAPYRLRCQWCADKGACNLKCADALEDKIQEEGRDTVAAFIAEPVIGGGGVIPAPDGYFARIREICDRNEVLFISDEVITGFGRTGRWFALEHWNVLPDMMSFAKGVTSAYLPLGGIMVSDEIRDTIASVPAENKYMHAATYSGHPTCCAVGLRNVEIMEQERLIDRAAKMGDRLHRNLETFWDIDIVGDIRGLGLIAAVELLADREKREAFDPALKVGEKVYQEMKSRGVYTRVRGDAVFFSPPLVITEQQVDRLTEVLRESIMAVRAGLGR